MALVVVRNTGRHSPSCLVQALIAKTLRSVLIIFPAAAAPPGAEPFIELDSPTGGLYETAKWEVETRTASEYAHLEKELRELEGIELRKVRYKSGGSQAVCSSACMSASFVCMPSSRCKLPRVVDQAA